MTRLKPRMRIFWIDWLRPVLIVVLIATAFRSAIADWNDVPTGSMKPTILEGDRIFVNKLAYDLRFPFTTLHLLTWADPTRGDIVVLNSPDDKTRLVKRVVGLPGDTVTMVANRLVVNRQPVVYELLPSPSGEGAGEIDPKVLVLEDLGSVSHTVMLTPGQPSAHSFGPILIPSDRYFVMGDNRDRSHDSRHFGFVERSSILGRATAVAASVNPDRSYRPRWERFFTALQ